MQDLGKIMEKFEDFCVGETHEAYKSYKFHLWRQELSERIKAYISSLRQLAKNYNFGVLEDRMIQDQVVMWSGKMRFEKSCWRIKKSTRQNVWS